MKWYSTYCTNSYAVCEFLNLLSEKLVGPGYIKITGDYIFYYHSEDLSK